MHLSHLIQLFLPFLFCLLRLLHLSLKILQSFPSLLNSVELNAVLVSSFKCEF